MRLEGTFKDINNNISYKVVIGRGTPLYIDDEVKEGNQVMFAGEEPVVISCDMTDSFEHVYIRQATVNLISNFDLRDYVVASNYTDIPVEISYTESGQVIFKGNVVPLQYNQDFAQEWNQFSIECVDILGTLEYLIFKNILDNYSHDYDYDSPRDLMNLIFNYLGFDEDPDDPNIDPTLIYNIDYDHTEDTRINPTIFLGESEDDYMNCYDVLNEIGKIYGIYFWQDGDVCKAENILLYDLTTTSPITKADYLSDDTNISVQEAYNRIKFEVDLSTIDEDFVDPFDDEYLETVSDKPERVLTELIYKNKDEEVGNLVGFKHLLDTAYGGQIIWQRGQQDDENVEIYDNYCNVLSNTLFDFGDHNYLNDGYGDTGHDIYLTLKWLYDHPGKGAFLEFGKTQNLMDPKDHPTVVQVDDMNKMLLIQVNGDRSQYSDADWQTIGDIIGTQIVENTPICSFELKDSYNLVPNDKSTTNYLVINGKITLNPIVPKTGPFPSKSDTWETDFDDEDFMNAENFWLRGRNNIQLCESYWNQVWSNRWLAISPRALFYDRCLRNDEDEDGMYYQNETWTNRQEEMGVVWPYNQYPNFTNKLALPYLSPKYEFFKYRASGYNYNGDADEVDTINQVSVLVCELKIGDKYLYEDFDSIDYVTFQKKSTFKWATLENCPSQVIDGQIVRQNWFTISINPAIGDALLGKEFDFNNTVDLRMNIDAEGIAIPIPYGSGLVGKVTFKILGPYNSVWTEAEKIGFCSLWARIFGLPPTIHKRYPLLAYVENILISDLTMKLYSNNGGKKRGKQDSDLVYYSYTTDEYIDEQEIECKLCTSLTTQEAIDLDIEYNLNNSSILTVDPNTGEMIPWTGMRYKGTDGIKLEEARVMEQYNIWKRPRKIIDTTLRLRTPQNAYDKTNYTFNYLEYGENDPQIYRTFAQEIDLKLGTIKCTMKELSDEPEEETPGEGQQGSQSQNYNGEIGSF